jgi:ABC-type sugar transport system ATPase subunit
MLDAWDSGIAFVSQELNLFPSLSILENTGWKVVPQSQVSARPRGRRAHTPLTRRAQRRRFGSWTGRPVATRLMPNFGS